tara:strand:- start:2295 stop:2897 length:603 start_codon:yes stop_codon:yes gene_type:complete
MKLYFSQNSPYARRARLTLHEAGLQYRVVEEDLTPRIENDTVLFANGPGGKVPALITETGAFIVESLLICRYLDDLSGNKLTPSQRGDRDKAIQLEGTASVLMDTLYFRTHEGRRDASKQVTTIKGKDVKITMAAYDALNNQIISFCDTINLGIIAAVSALGYADWRHPTDNWRDGRPALADWFEKISERPAMQLTAPVV